MRRATGPRYYRSRRGWYVWYQGRQIRLAIGGEYDPEVQRAAWQRYREVVPAQEISVRAITLEEFSRLRSEGSKEFFYVVTFMRFTGVRPAEVCAITANDIRASEPSFNVFLRDGIVRDGILRIGDHTRPLEGTGIVIYKEMARRFPAGPLFRSPGSRPWTVDSLHSAFVQRRDRLGLDKDLTPFSLRHAYAVEFLEYEGSVADLAERLGIGIVQCRRLYGGVQRRW